MHLRDRLTFYCTLHINFLFTVHPFKLNWLQYALHNLQKTPNDPETNVIFLAKYFLILLTICDVFSQFERSPQNINYEEHQTKPNSPQIGPRPGDPGLDSVKTARKIRDQTRHDCCSVYEKMSAFIISQ